MTFLGRTSIFTTKHKIVSYWCSKVYCSFATLPSFGDEVSKGSDIDGDNETRVNNIGLAVQSTILQSVTHDQKRRKFANEISKGPGLKDFVTNSFVQPVTCERVPYVSNTSVNGKNRKGK
jgi:hypothetical protein